MPLAAVAMAPKPLCLPLRAAHASGPPLRVKVQESQLSSGTPKGLRRTTPSYHPLRHVICCSTSHGAYGPRPFYFNPSAYRKVRLDLVKADGKEGHLVLVDESASGQWQDGKIQGLVLCVGGDTLDCIVRRIRKKAHVRPMSLDLLWGILEHLQAVNNAEWQVVRVAVVAMTNDTYIGRAFFGDKESGQVYWDCDIRPSDAVYLSQRCDCPIYVDNLVWLQNVATFAQLQDIMGNMSVPQEKPEQKDSKAIDVAEVVGSRKAGVLDDDPERIKMMKRMLAMAIKEENYTLAAKLRDHPAFAMYDQMHLYKQLGRNFEAKKLADELNKDPSQYNAFLDERIGGTLRPDVPDTRQEYNQP